MYSPAVVTGVVFSRLVVVLIYTRAQGFNQNRTLVRQIKFLSESIAGYAQTLLPMQYVGGHRNLYTVPRLRIMGTLTIDIRMECRMSTPVTHVVCRHFFGLAH